MGLGTRGSIQGPRVALGPFLAAPMRYGHQRWKATPGSFSLSQGRLRWVGLGVGGQALHVCAELEKEVEGGHYQSTRQDVMEEPGVGTCWTRRGTWGLWTRLQAPGEEEAPS